MSKSRGIPYYVNRATGESVWERPTAAAPSASDTTRMRASHLLVKHAQSRRPSSWRQARPAPRSS